MHRNLEGVIRSSCAGLAALSLAACGAGTPADAPAAGPHKEVIAPPGASTMGPYSPGIRTGNLIFLSGAIGSAEEGGLVEGGIGPETRRALEILQSRLELAGATLADAVKCTVFLADIADYRAMNEVYSEFFPQNAPARSTVAVGALVADARVEIECFAAVPG